MEEISSLKGVISEKESQCEEQLEAIESLKEDVEQCREDMRWVCLCSLMPEPLF